MRTVDLTQAFSCFYVLRSNLVIQVFEALRRFIYYKRGKWNTRRTVPVRPWPSLFHFSTHTTNSPIYTWVWNYKSSCIEIKMGTMPRRFVKLIYITAALVSTLCAWQYLALGCRLASFGPKLTSHRQYSPIYTWN